MKSIGTQAPAPSVDSAHEAESRLQCVIDLSSNYYWEQDENHRFTVLHHRHTEPEDEPQRFVGKTSWELGSTPISGSWEEHKAIRRARRPFEDFIVRQTDAGGRERYLSISGVPVFRADGRFAGYRGISKDVTKDKRDERLLSLERSVTAILIQADDPAEALRAAIRAVCQSEGWDAGQYWTVDETGGCMRFSVGWSVTKRAIERITAEARDLAFEPGVGLVGIVWQTQEPLWVPELRKEHRVKRADVAERTGWNSAFLFPVFHRGKTIGVLDFNARKIPESDDRLLQIIQLLGMQIGNFYERAIALQRLRESEERYSSTVEMAAIGIGHVAPDGRFIHVNRQFCEMLGYSKEELLQLTIKDISYADDADATDEDRARLHRGEIRSLKAEKRYVRKDGTPIWVRLAAAAKRGGDGAVLYDISAVEDISSRKRVEERVQYLATHDEMTKLPNRAQFMDALGRAIASAERRASQCAVLFIDLDRFKIINDTLGHGAGDRLLKETSRRLKGCLRGSDVVARFGGDEFVVLLEQLSGPAEAAAVARKILSSVLEPVQIMGHECRVTASIGVARYPADGRDPASLMRNADIAMYLAKEEGKNNFQFYAKDMSRMSVERLRLEAHLRRALEEGEFSLQYQAKVDLKCGEISGTEALLRWWNRDVGTVPPGQFIPLAEDTGLIVPIGNWVLRTACRQNVAWQRRGLPAVVMAVNLSARQFKDPGLLQDIADVLQQTGMAPDLLELEITESMIMNNVEQAAERVAEIKKLGVRLAIDDFGTGYSSLSQLKRFPIDTLKVDRSFIRDIPANAADKAIAEAVISMGKTLGVVVVAEGVETAEQYAFLRASGCDQMQGYYFSKPCHPDAFAALLDAAVPASAESALAVT